MSESLLRHMVEQRITFREELGDTVVEIAEGVGDFVANHPVLATVAAGYVLDRTIKAARGSATIDVVTNTLKFYARTPQERRIQQQLVDTLVDSKHYKVMRKTSENGATVWILRRQPR